MRERECVAPMMNKKLWITISIAYVMVAVFSVASFAVLKEERDIVFATIGESQLLGDMYFPEGEGPFPGILFIHGGGFVAGDKAWEGQPTFLRMLADNGYLVFSINYRLVKDGVFFPESIQDTKCGLAWFKTNAEKYGLDKNRLAVLGISAGAYFSEMIAFTPNEEEFQPVCEGVTDMDTSVNAAVFYYGPTNFITIKSTISTVLKMEMSRLADLKTKAELKDYMIKYSPVNHVKKDLPPIFIGFTTNDHLVSSSQQWELMEVLDKASATYEYYEAKGENLDHGYVLLDLPEAEETHRRTLLFLEKYLTSDKQPTE